MKYIFLLGMFFLFMCDHSQYHEVKEFNSSKLLPGNEIGVFTYRYALHRKGDMVFSKPAKRLKNNSFICSYDLKNKKVKILHKKTENTSHSQCNYHIQSTFGSTLLISEPKVTLAGNVPNYFRSFSLLTLPDNKLTPVPLRQDSVEDGIEPGHVYLASEQGHLVVLKKARSSKPNFIWVYKAREFYKLTNFGRYHGVKANKIYYYDATDRLFKSYNVKSKKIQKEDIRKYSKLRPVVDIALMSRRKYLELGKKKNGTWHYQRIKIDTNIFK